MGGSKASAITLSQLEEEFDNFFKLVNDENFYRKYDEFIDLLLTYKIELSRNEMLQFFVYYYESRDLNEAQEEVLLDTESRLTGYCSPDEIIVW